MSLVTTERVNDYEIGSRKAEIKSIKAEIQAIKDDENMRPSEKKVLISELRKTLSSCKLEYNNLLQSIRNNFV